MENMKQFMEKQSININIDEIMHNVLKFPKLQLFENIPIYEESRFFCKTLPRNLESISYNTVIKNKFKFLETNIYIPITEYIKDRFRNVVNKCMTDILFYVVWFYKHKVFTNTKNSEYDPHEFFIHGEYIRNYFEKEYTPCKTFGVNIPPYNEEFMEIVKLFFDTICTYENIKSYRFEGQRFYEGIKIYTLCPQIENKTFMKFVLSRPYIKEILDLFDKSKWINLLETINDIKIELIISLNSYDIKVDFDVNCLRLNIPNSENDPEKILNILTNQANILPIKLDLGYEIDDTYVWDDISIMSLYDIVDMMGNTHNDYSMIHKCFIDQILHNISNKKLIIFNKNGKIQISHSETSDNDCILFIIDRKDIFRDTWIKKSDYEPKIIMENLEYMVQNGWSCLNKKCNNKNCILHQI
ncbi:DUF5769 domain-containing protein [Megavirus chiliensis]|uniref:Uncharacterized protein n=2 Tax=Megamimivirinae TaxID=3044648 RepID=A0A2L2DL93_MIMIV|nr:hypothetical protein MegaChil _gp0095 [Megavirus chiliensis]AEQ33033.1 DUF5769 domain-containing protein [Megavirus chiliensis]AVG46936.1 hypothetical protein [Acanthamoeba polyphaga mimivirus]